MSQCPVCSTEIQDSFGLVECPGCKKILFADFDGTLKVQDEVGAEDSAAAPEGFDAEESASSSFSEDWNAEPEHNPPAPSLDALDPAVEPDSNIEEAQFEEAQDVTAKESLSMIDEVSAFANSEASSLKHGTIIYNLTIKNIDTEDLREEILDVLRENKLNIDIKKLKFSLPTLELKDLNPVKVSVIVSKIKHLPVEVEWAQKSMLTDEESSLD